MTKPMCCPMSFSNEYTFNNGAMECDPTCAWAVIDGDDDFSDNPRYACGMIALQGAWLPIINSRPLNNDSKSVDDDSLLPQDNSSKVYVVESDDLWSYSPNISIRGIYSSHEAAKQERDRLQKIYDEDEYSFYVKEYEVH